MIVGDQIPDRPMQVHVEITSFCNLACGFCPVHRAKRGAPLSKAEIEGVLRQAAALDPAYVDFVNYNEPLACKDFFDHAGLLTELLGHGRLGLVTNGTIMSEAIARRILDLHPKQVVFSIDAFTRETYARVRPRWTPSGPREDLGLRDAIYENVDLYLRCVAESETGAWPVVEMVVCDLNFHEVEATRGYWLPRIHNQFLAINCTGRGGERAFTVPDDVPCRVVLDGLWVLSDGRVVACCEDWNALDCVGDVREESLAAIWSGERIRRFRERHLAGKKRDLRACAGCQVSLSTTDYYKFPERTRPEVLADLRARGRGGVLDNI